ncbi:MAG: DUF4846 domain-containing protein [Candidatus Zixiibacteriota bacterium]|nr:MAG: DUF4846 domain-containing protein [candidate division Zixibacteria bacterium]
MKIIIPFYLLSIFLFNTSFAQYGWLADYDSSESILSRIPPPEGYKRIEVEEGSFQEWLRNLPLKEGKPPIYLYNGEKKFFQLANYAVIDIDVGDQDLQQCADAVIRLRSEYFYSKGHYDSISFNFTSGHRFRYSDWLKGITPEVKNNEVSWKQLSERENNREVFKEYLEILFTYAGSYSLSEELRKVPDINNMRIGDVFIEGGFPGHAVIVVDIAESVKNKMKIFLLAQSYTPAQDMHIIKNPTSFGLSPWFKLDFRKRLYMLEWVFGRDDLKRFK